MLTASHLMETVNVGTGESTVNGPISFAHQFIRKLEGELATAKQELVQTVSMLHKQLCKGLYKLHTQSLQIEQFE